MSDRVSRIVRPRVGRSVVVASALAVAGLVTARAGAQVSSVNLQFNGSGNTVAATGFDAAYNPNPAGFSLTAGTLVVLTANGDTFGDYENDPDSAQNFFYTGMTVGARTVVEARVNALNLNQNFHGGGIWVGTDEDHYLRLGIIYNSFEGGIAVEALREQEDRWPGDTAGGTVPAPFPNRPGADIESRYLGVQPNGDVNNAILRIVRDRNAVAGYISLNNGATFSRIGGDTYSFNSLATDATSLPIDNRTAANPNNPDTTSHTVEGGFKVGAYAIGGGSAAIQFDSFTAVTGVPTYTGPAGGDYTSDANWTAGLGAPTNIESTAVLPATGAARTLNVASNITATNITFANANGDTLAGTGEVRFDWFYFPTHPDYYTNGPGTVAVTAGNNTISAPTVLAHLHNFDVSSGATLTLSNMQASPVDNVDAGVRKLGAGTLRVNRLLTPNVNVQAGTLQVVPGGGAANVSRVNAITIAGGTTPTARLDLADNALVLDYTGTPSPIATIQAQLKSGYGTGTFNGQGIVSSTGATDASHAIGFAEASSLVTVPALFGTVDATAVLFRYTYKGDTDLNNIVNFADLLALSQNYDPAGSGKTWVNGDSDYNGVVNFNDLLALAQNYGLGGLTEGQAAQFSSSFASDFALAQSLVPEPTTLLGLAGGGVALASRRRSRPSVGSPSSRSLT